MARVYSEAEIAAILARVAERAPTGDGPAVGLTVEEIERVAAEAGLDPALVRAAAADLDGAPVGAAPGARIAEQWLDGPFSEVAWEDTVALLRARFGPNHLQQPSRGGGASTDTARLGAAFEWTHVAPWSGVTTTVTASPRGGRTLVRAMQTRPPLGDARRTAALVAGLLALLPGLGLGAAVDGATGSTAVGIVALMLWVIAAVAIGASVGASRLQQRRAVRERQADAALEATLADVARRLQPPAEPAAVPTARVDFDAVVGEDDEATGDPGRRERRRSAS